MLDPMAYAYGLFVAALGVLPGFLLGWRWRGYHEASEDRKALKRISDDQRVVIDYAAGSSVPPPQRADTPVQRGTETFDASQIPIFKTNAGEAIGSPRNWDKRLEKFGGPAAIPYEELEGMFLDQFLLRYFYSLMPERWDFEMPATVSSMKPWNAFVWMQPWAKEMPLLFEQMTGYSLNEIQLNNAIAEWARRVSKSSTVVK